MLRARPGCSPALPPELNRNPAAHHATRLAPRRLCAVLCMVLLACDGGTKGESVGDASSGATGDDENGATVDDGATGDELDGASPGEAEGGTPLPQDSSVGGDGDGGSAETKGLQLDDFAPFTDARADWEDALRSGTEAAPPLPPLASPLDPRRDEAWEAYANAVQQRPGTQYLPFGPALGGQPTTGMAAAASLVLAGDDPDALLALTDFDLPGGGARFTGACERYLARAGADAEAGYRALCAERGTVLAWGRVNELRVHGVRLMRGAACGLPSAVYGAYTPADDDSHGVYEWPAALAREEDGRQPCIGLFVDAEGLDSAGTSLGRGWMFLKAVADLERVAFPYSERDPQRGRVDDDTGAPRGEFVSNRWLFGSGAGVYLGQSPLWLFRADSLTEDNVPVLLDALNGQAPLCTAAPEPDAPPCILMPQAPFVFVSSAQALWVRQALHSQDARFPADPESGLLFRNPYELMNVSRADSLRTVVKDVLEFFEDTETSTRTPAQRRLDAAQLSAPWHSLQTYRSTFSGFTLTDRKRMILLPLNETHMLAIPDQGYFELGGLSDEAVADLFDSDIAQILSALSQPSNDEPYTFQNWIEDP